MNENLIKDRIGKSEPASYPLKTAMPDLSPHPASSLEWWFVQGHIKSDKLGRREFMLSFFRQAGKQTRQDGHMLLVTSLDVATGKHSVLSQVSKELVENFNHDAPGDIEKSGIDQKIASAVLKEMKASGPPRPIHTQEEAVCIGVKPPSIEWRDFSLQQRDDCIEIAFTLPGEELVCRLTAAPEANWFEGRDLGQGELGTMAYDCCPRLQLSGTVAGESVKGQTWFDHQWGGYGWMRAAGESSSVFGWDWLGITLDDGRDLIVMVHRNMRTHEPVSRFAILFDGMRPPEKIEDVTITGLTEWRSLETMIDYPIHCRIEIPQLAANLEFTPDVDDQEIPVFGLINAIWEGAGRIAGEIDGSKVSGRARLELHGYGYLLNFDDYKDKWVERIDRVITDFLPKQLDQSHLVQHLGEPRWGYDAKAQTAMFSQPVWDLLSRGGKHWRPIFGYLLLDALGTDVGPYETMISTITELVHNGSVIIDDIEDTSLKRRGEETIHLRYGLPAAINAGNTLYFLPLLSIAQQGDLDLEQRDAIYRSINQMFVQAHFGQAQDLYWSKLDPARRRELLDDEATGPLILQAHAFKSAAAVKATAELVCIIAKSEQKVTNVCCRLAESWGVAFQMVDDINNFSTSQRWGKVRGEDVIEGKFSYVIHKAVRLLQGDTKQRLLDILTSKELRHSEAGLEEAIMLIETSGSLEACRDEANRLIAEDWPAFSAALPSSRSKFMIRVLLEKLIGAPFEM